MDSFVLGVLSSRLCVYGTFLLSTARTGTLHYSVLICSYFSGAWEKDVGVLLVSSCLNKSFIEDFTRDITLGLEDLSHQEFMWQLVLIIL